MGVSLTDIILFGKATSEHLHTKGLRILGKHKLFWGTLGRVIAVVVKGVPPLVLPDAIAGKVVSLKAFGGTKQGLPDGYDPVNFIYFLDGAYLLTNLVPTYDCKIEIDFATTSLPAGSTTFVGGRSGSVAGDGLQLAKTSGGIFIVDAFGSRYTSSVTPLANTRYKFTFDNQVATLESGGSTLFTNTFTDTGATGGAFAINGLNTNDVITGNLAGIYLYSFKVWDNQGNLIANYVPCAKTNPLTVGLYDLATDTFINAPTSGTWAAGPAAGAKVTPTPDAPVNIVCNNGKIKARMSSGLPLGYQRVSFVKSNKGIDLGVKTTHNTVLSARFRRSVSGSQYLYVSDSNSSGTTNTTAYISGAGNWRFGNRTTSISVPADTWIVSVQNKLGVTLDGETVGTYSSVNAFTSTNNLNAFSAVSEALILIDYIKMQEYGSDTLTHHWVACKRYDGALGLYDLVDGVFYTNSSASISAGSVTDSIEIYTDGTQETIAIKDDQNTTVCSATAEMLLSLGNYTDEQEIVHGNITRKVGIAVLTGAESWTVSGTVGTDNCRFVSDITSVTSGATVSLCTHIDRIIQSGNAEQSDRPCIRFTTGTGTAAFYAEDNSTTLAQWKAWLAGQAALGTPVIVVYPLVDSTTETVTGQPMQTVEGDNTAEITQASMSGLELEVTYMAGVTLTVEEVEDAQLSPDVEVTIQ